MSFLWEFLRSPLTVGALRPAQMDAVRVFVSLTADHLCHGKRGQLMQAYREGQEDQLGALGLVLNAAVLWTTRYLDAAVEELRALPAEEREYDVLDEDGGEEYADALARR